MAYDTQAQAFRSVHLCHCRQPATWIARAYIGPIADVAAIADDRWAACDEHLADAIRNLIARSADLHPTIMVRPEQSIPTTQESER